MAQLKVLIILINLALLRLAGGAVQAGAQNETQASEKVRGVEGARLASAGPISVLEQLNSLDFAPSQQQQVGADQDEGSRKSGAPVATTKTRGVSGKQTKRRPRAGQSLGSLASLALNLLGQLEKVDVRRVLADLAAQTQARAAPSQAAQTQQQQQQRDGKLNVSALSAETGQLLSITKQLVKLARNQVLANDFGSYFSPAPAGLYGAPASWLGPGIGGGSATGAGLFASGPGAMLSAASHAIHDSLELAGHHPASGAMLKSEWLWWLAPAVIVIGTGVIVVPLIAAWLVSQAMSQNTFTVAAGRRRRRKRQTSAADLTGAAQPALAIHADLFKLLDLNQLLDEAPELLAHKLAHFHRALEQAGGGGGGGGGFFARELKRREAAGGGELRF